jgi:hypothetical protein
MTVTGKLEIVSGGQCVTVTGIDEGRGQIGEVGYYSADTFTGDVLTMGAETDDWTFRGREITGSRDGGASFLLGDYAQGPNGNFYVAAFIFVTWMFESFLGEWRLNDWGPNGRGCNPYALYDRPIWETDGEDDRRRRVLEDRRLYTESLADSFRAVADMFDALARLARIREELSDWRYRPGQMSA